MESLPAASSASDAIAAPCPALKIMPLAINHAILGE
jgi:hypothetical protein